MKTIFFWHFISFHSRFESIHGGGLVYLGWGLGFFVGGGFLVFGWVFLGGFLFFRNLKTTSKF